MNYNFLNLLLIGKNLQFLEPSVSHTKVLIYLYKLQSTNLIHSTSRKICLNTFLNSTEENFYIYEKNFKSLTYIYLFSYHQNTGSQ